MTKKKKYNQKKKEEKAEFAVCLSKNVDVFFLTCERREDIILIRFV